MITRGVPIIGPADISATDMVILVISVIGKILDSTPIFAHAFIVILFNANC